MTKNDSSRAMVNTKKRVTLFLDSIVLENIKKDAQINARTYNAHIGFILTEMFKNKNIESKA